MAKEESEYTFYVNTDPTSRAALYISGQEMFNDLVVVENATENSGSDFTSLDLSGRRRSIWLAAGEPVPLELVYAVSGKGTKKN